MKFIVGALVIAGFISCSNHEEKQPAAPDSISSVQQLITGKTFITNRVGTLSPFATGIDKDKPFQWFDEEKNPSKFMKDYEDDRKKFQLTFVNDTALRISDDGKTWDASYEIDDSTKEEEKPGIRLRLSYEDKENSMSFPGATTPMMLTASYLIAAISGDAMILQAPREFNRQHVILWMKQK